MQKIMVVLILVLSSVLHAEEEPDGLFMLLDSFSTSQSELSNEWESFTDKVMGGSSEMTVTRLSDSEGKYLRIKGRVVSGKNDGFIQIRQKLSSSTRVFDASSYRGIRLRVRGRGSGYYIFLKTTNTPMPWQNYVAPIAVSSSWTVVDVPWNFFRAGGSGKLAKLRINKLKSIAIAAYGESFDVQIDIDEIAFF